MRGNAHTRKQISLERRRERAKERTRNNFARSTSYHSVRHHHCQGSHDMAVAWQILSFDAVVTDTIQL